jgi:hypothetical protein
MKTIRFLLILSILVSIFTPQIAKASNNLETIPTFSILSVVRDNSVTIQTKNFPANDTFDVLMNVMGTQGKNGIKVAVASSGKGGTLTKTFTIPAQLHGLKQISIRLQSNTGSGYYSYNWFYNNTTGSSSGNNGTASSTKIPTFTISSVVRNKSVTIVTKDFPANDNFDVLMNVYGTQGKNGILVDTIASGEGGSLTATFTIPAELKGLSKISIRLQSNKGTGYYSYNWFYNNTTD